MLQITTKHCPVLQCPIQTLQRAICTNPMNTVAIELQMMIMPYWYWLNCYMPSFMVIWLELYATAQCLCSYAAELEKLSAVRSFDFRYFPDFSQSESLLLDFWIFIVTMGLVNIVLNRTSSSMKLIVTYLTYFTAADLVVFNEIA
jgi:hypothetical protein